MDRKGKRHVKGEKTRRADRKRRKAGPLNRYQIEKTVPNISSSWEKLSTFGETNVTINPSVSYRIINFCTVFAFISGLVKCKECGGNVQFCEGSRRGLGFKIVVKCESCEPKEVNSCPLVKYAYEVNRRFIFAMRLLGVGLAGAEKFCAFMDLPRPVLKPFYSTIISQIHDATECIRKLSIKKAGELEITLTNEKCENATGLTVSSDGTWRKRGFSSLYGVATIIGYYSKKVLDICVKSAYCKACALWKNKTHLPNYETWLEEHEKDCEASHIGTAGNMEPDGVIEMFSRAEELHGKRYINYIGDTDSKTHSKIVEKISPDVKKKECVNHLQKRIGRRLRNCKKTTKGFGDKGKFTANLITDLTTYYGLAIRCHCDSRENMKKAIWATFLHKSSTDEKPQHKNCPTGENSWCRWQKASATGTLDNYKHKPALSGGVAAAIKPIYEDLSRDDLLERCLGAFNQNCNDSLNNVIWKFAPKLLFSGSSIVKIATNLSTILFNDGHVSLLDVLQLLGIEIGQAVYDYCHEIDKERMKAAERKARRETPGVSWRGHGDDGDDGDAVMDAEELLYGPGNSE